MSAKAWLEGHEFDLEELAQLLSTGDTRVAKDADGYYLTSTKIDAPPGERTVYEVAQGLLPTINGIGRSYNPNYRPVALNGRYLDGRGQRIILAIAGTAESRSKAHAVMVGGTGVSVPTPSTRYATLADKDPNVAEALVLMGGAEPLGWVELYKVYEIIRDAVRPQKVEKIGWVSPGDLDSFTAAGQPSRCERCSSPPCSSKRNATKEKVDDHQ